MGLILISVRFILFYVMSVTAVADWSSGDTNRQLAFTALQLVDWAQTREIVRNPDYYETNPILGKYPSKTEVDVYFAAATLGHYLVSRALPPDYRKVWQYVWIGVQVGYVTHNYQIGLRIRF
jgi:hypothetical protein